MNAQQVTVGQLVQWIIENRRDGAFKGYSLNTIYEEVMEGLENNTLVYYIDGDGYIQGIAVGRRNDDRRSVHVFDVLATMPGILKLFVIEFVRRYPGYSITGTKRNGSKRYFADMQKVLRKL